MGAAVGREADVVAFFERLSEAPYQYDFYQTLRRLECLYRDQPRWGEALRPADERVRLGQDPDLSFAPAPLASFSRGEHDLVPRLQVRLFGLLGPNGPLPLHITEYVRERLRNAGDPTLSRFLDLFHHRFLQLFYRAWAQAQPHVGHDRVESDRFAVYVGAFIGIAPQPFRRRDTIPDVAKLFHAGTLVRQVRNADGLAAILQHFFRVPARIEQFVGHWLVLGTRERTSLGRHGALLGSAAVLGRCVWDRQHKFRVRLGPLGLRQYENFLPRPPKRPSSEGGPGAPREQSSDGGPAAPRPRSAEGEPAGPKLRSPDATGPPKPPSGEGGLNQLVDWIRLYDCFERDWDLQLILTRREVPRLTLGGVGQLGWTTWLGVLPGDRDADDLCLHAESAIDRFGVRA